ncbi:MAG: hypothetical protein GY699_10665 [Desulfobacteraceae bacterium]|nr:hypothetical protein [Desulfobacteraceae bacterium]
MKEFGSILCAILIALVTCPVSKADDVKPGPESDKQKPAGMQETELKNIAKTKDGFTAGLWLTEDKAMVEKRSKSGAKDKIPVTYLVERDTPVYAIICFANQKRNKKKTSHVSYDLLVLKPDGEIFKVQKNGTGCKDRRSIKKNSIRMGRDFMEILIKADDPQGRYTVKANVIDEVAGTTLTLQHYFEVPGFKPLAGYDFNYDYRPEMEKQAKLKAKQEEEKLAAMFKPVAGISLEKYAVINAKYVHGENMDVILKKEKIKKASWEKASKTWNERMSKQDKEFRLSQAYSISFFNAGVGQYADAGRDLAQAMKNNSKLTGKPPIPQKKWEEISQAISKGIENGQQADEVLKSRNINPYDWSVVSFWWSKAMTQQYSQQALK